MEQVQEEQEAGQGEAGGHQGAQGEPEPGQAGLQGGQPGQGPDVPGRAPPHLDQVVG